MTILHSIILGIIQGLTEFLPVSSSAHLNLFPWLMGWEMTESFDVALHIGTLLAMVIFFFKDWVNLVKGGFNMLVKKEVTRDGRMFWFLVFATIPAGALSLVLDKLSDKLLGEEALGLNGAMLVIGITLILLGVILYVADLKGENNIDYNHLNIKQVIYIALSQAVAAAFPGTSRSGITMTTARFLGVDRSSAARLSFMLAMPITLAAVVFDLDQFAFDAPFFLGILFSFIVGMIVVKFLLDYLKTRSFKVFAIYRVVAGIVVIVAFIVKSF